MKKLLLLTLLLAAVTTLNAQNLQQPAWLFPLYFEDANGKKDTVYIGYDSTACWDVPMCLDSIFERWEVIDTSKFNVALYQYPYYDITDIMLTDTVLKRIVMRGYNLDDPIGSPIGFIKGKMPVTMRWNPNLLYSNSLPFPDISGKPRARADIWCSGYSCPFDIPLVLTDSAHTGDFPIAAADSYTFVDPWGQTPNEAIYGLNIRIVPYDLIISTSNISSTKVLKIFPNPTVDNITVANNFSPQTVIEIFDLFGNIILEKFSNESYTLINLNNLIPAIYIVRINNKNYFKLIKL